MSTSSVGLSAEEAVANDLKSSGYKILARNWRTRQCEIDIVAYKDNCLYFVEVKFRRGDSQGSGFEYLTPKKIKQLKFAGQLWNAENDWEGDWIILAASATQEGPELKIEGYEEVGAFS